MTPDIHSSSVIEALLFARDVPLTVEQIRRVFDRLQAMGELENTYILYTADHGMALGRHGLQGKQNPLSVRQRPAWQTKPVQYLDFVLHRYSGK